MLNEIKLFFENLTHFRQLLNEGVGEGTVIDAIQKHKIVYIYYAGDNTIMKGYRTIKPMVLGYSKSEEAKTNPYMLLRAWEIAGNSDSQKRYNDEKGRPQFGWRLFRVDKITSFLPTGKIFRTDTFSPEMIEQYNPNDSQMTNIVAAVQITDKQPQTSKQGSVVAQKIPEPSSAFAGQKEKFQYFSQAGKKQREATADEIQHLWSISKGIKKKSPEKLLVVTDQHGDMVLKDVSQKDKLPPESIVGNLKDLYIKLVKPNEKVDTSFFNKKMSEFNKTNIEQNNIEKKTFFKQ
jgi:hypothetical protein